MTVDTHRAAPTGRVRRAVTHVERVMGTAVSFRLLPADGVPTQRITALVRAACDVLHRADAVFSTWDSRSPVSELRSGRRGLEQCPPEVAEVLALCELARSRSAGWFDPWSMPGGIDPTGLVKGWAIERAVETIQSPDIVAGLVNGGGDVAGFGSPAPGEPWRIGIRHPWRPGALACVVPLDGAVATSGTYERGAHLVDPRTRAPHARAASATVCGPSLAMADALATALAVGGGDALAAVAACDGYEGYAIGVDGSEMSTSAMRFCD